MQDNIILMVRKVGFTGWNNFKKKTQETRVTWKEGERNERIEQIFDHIILEKQKDLKKNYKSFLYLWI